MTERLEPGETIEWQAAGLRCPVCQQPALTAVATVWRTPDGDARRLSLRCAAGCDDDAVWVAWRDLLARWQLS